MIWKGQDSYLLKSYSFSGSVSSPLKGGLLFKSFWMLWIICVIQNFATNCPLNSSHAFPSPGSLAHHWPSCNLQIPSIMPRPLKSHWHYEDLPYLPTKATFSSQLCVNHLALTMYCHKPLRVHLCIYRLITLAWVKILKNENCILFMFLFSITFRSMLFSLIRT